MPHAEYKYIHVTQLGKTFAAEVSGCDFSKPISPGVFAEIHRAITKVSFSPSISHSCSIVQPLLSALCSPDKLTTFHT
jgi:hypothetical protein